jgi:DNA-binding NarL/FixJ family response regulator
VIRILIADDHTIVREGLVQLLDEVADFTIAGIAANGHEVLAQVRNGGFDMVLLDLNMPGPHGIELITQLKAETPVLHVLVLSMHNEEQFAVRALQAGAAGYLTKQSAVDELVAAMRAVIAGNTYISSAVAQAMVMDMIRSRLATPPSELSQREFSVLVMIGRGRALNEIADSLHLSPKTVSTYKARVLEKLGLANTADLVRYAIDHRLLEERRGALASPQ